jgi:predicted metal-dependent hydrolase
MSMSTEPLVAERPPIKARKMDFPFTTSNIPRHWVAGSTFATAMANGLHLVFPLGERFFVRSVRAYADRIADDPKLAADVRGFVGQEMRHGLEHERFFDVMREQGYEIDGFLRFYEKLAFGILEPNVPKKLALSVTVAAEHLTATFAEAAFEKGVVSQFFHPTMRDLLLWHAAEEIEHKAVAFDVLQRVDPSYALRIAGAAVATALFVSFWTMGAVTLLRQEKGLSLRTMLQQRREAKKRGMVGGTDITKAFIEYLKPGFHPSQKDNYHLAKNYFESLGRAAAAA